jgi:hypothetical protein
MGTVTHWMHGFRDPLGSVHALDAVTHWVQGISGFRIEGVGGAERHRVTVTEDSDEIFYFI